MNLISMMNHRLHDIMNKRIYHIRYGVLPWKHGTPWQLRTREIKQDQLNRRITFIPKLLYFMSSNPA
jgi:hypothetical protein